MLNGDAGNDSLIGGVGSDRFVLSQDGGKDIIADFEDGKDAIILADSMTFADLSMGTTNNQTLMTLLTAGKLLATLNGVPSRASIQNYCRWWRLCRQATATNGTDASHRRSGGIETGFLVTDRQDFGEKFPKNPVSLSTVPTL